MRVLIVDDQEDSRSVVGAMLRNLGHEIIEASSGKTAIELALSRSPDVILMDLSMPDVDGNVATAALRTISSSLHTPVIAMSAFREKFSPDAAFAAGCDAYIEKPLNMIELSAVLKGFQKGAA